MGQGFIFLLTDEASINVNSTQKLIFGSVLAFDSQPKEEPFLGSVCRKPDNTNGAALGNFYLLDCI